MTHRRWSHLIAAAMLAVAVSAAIAAPAAAVPDAAAAATAYLEARAAAVTVTDPASTLAPWIGRQGPLAAAECAIARGTARRAALSRHRIDSVIAKVAIVGADQDAGGLTATINAHVVTTTVWHTASGARSTEASGIDHALSLARVGDTWRVTADRYTDLMAPACLEAAGASRAAVRGAGDRLERAASRPQPAPQGGSKWTTPSQGPRRYTDTLYYDREACRDYANKYALSYNPTYVRFDADCADFASQCARAGGMPPAFADYDSGWWYDKQGTSSPANDRYSLSWINVTKQMGYWNTRRTDWVASIGSVGKGDYIYYDWTGNGSWDHVAVLAGTNSAGQKVVDAHTTDYYRVFWKLGSSATHYKFARVRAYWVV
jgi:cell wall-associated NlpC family hydrolase